MYSEERGVAKDWKTIYYLYTKDEELYAYSLDKKELKRFMKYRNDIFYKFKDSIPEDMLKEFIMTNGDKKIHNYKFFIGRNRSITIPLAMHEISYLNFEEAYGVQKIALSTITPNLFRKSIFSALHTLGYIDAWMTWMYGVKEEERMKTIRSFIIYAGETLNIERFLSDML